MTNREKFKEVFGKDFWDIEMIDRNTYEIYNWLNKEYELPNPSFMEDDDKLNNIGKLEKELSDLKESLSLIRNDFQEGSGDSNG